MGRVLRPRKVVRGRILRAKGYLYIEIVENHIIMGKLQEVTKNPFNIRYNKCNSWVGQTGEYRGFCVFSHVSYGCRAAYRLLCNYIKRGINTPSDIIYRYAPPSENDTENYINFVCKSASLSRDEIMSVETIDSYWRLLSLMAAMHKIESGCKIEEQTLNLYITKCYE